jgi:3-methylcrotonyl-CoA carboxylase alpha subunit
VLQSDEGRRSVAIDDGPPRAVEQVRVDDGARRVEAVVDGRPLVAWYARGAAQVAIAGTRGTVTVRRADALRAGDARTAGEGRLVAPLPGVVSVVLVAAGARVERDAPLVVVEAMKMEHTLRARAAGRVAEVRCLAGDRVEEGMELVVVEADDATTARAAPAELDPPTG